MADDAVIIAARRTPIATRGRGLSGLRLEDLAAPAIRAALEDAATAAGCDIRPADVVLGNCMGPGGNPARVSALAAGLGVEMPGATVDRQCGSGLAAVIDACAAIRSGDARPRVAGGVESASTAPVRSLDGVPYSRAPFVPAGWPDPDMLQAADDLARARGIGRDRQEAHALRSHQRARAARDAGRLTGEIVRVAGRVADEIVGHAEALLPRLAPLVPGGTVTAGTATRISDGAAAVVVVPRQGSGGTAGLLLRGSAIVGCDPRLPGIGAAPATLAALENAEATVPQIAAFEIVEAFAAQSLAVLDLLGIADDDPRVCADGGSLALGHPWGASGAVSVVRLFSRLIHDGAPPGTLGVAAASVGGGMGVAVVVEVVR
ncbi:thiolase family protein [Myceligenerans pegani]|uniref:Probable acetyl-CoA acetyltransferase n=1 Tax=Myceligenerans pegani TaxID=2776917 RepID=A0ABR9N540_9MICO|nr:thiolase family protein [Myceligenerans sp. TRM 65318]MBE1878470.1 thiolase family protein [Myceligenerans sp. TRM 65318]MBE3020741.1 thiolase family protein [Myceligenerans sp. TRM 65318]